MNAHMFNQTTKCMKNVLFAIFCCATFLDCNKPKEEATQPVAVTPPDQEIGDSKYVEIAKKGFAQLASGDIDAWMTDFSDNAKYYSSLRDSLIGKPAISAYWKDRRANVIDKMEFVNGYWSPFKVNKAQNTAPLGNYALTWVVVNVTYKNSKSVSLLLHTAFHFDANDKIDLVEMFYDQSPIKEALAKK